MSEAPQVNEPEARSPTGEIKDQSQKTETIIETKKEIPPSTVTETKVEPEVKVESKDKPSLLNDKTEKEKVEAKGAPEKYEFKAPADWAEKGFELDGEIIAEATPLFKELNLSNEQAQKLIDLYAKESMKQHEASIKLVADQNKDWTDKAKADPEIGNKLDQVRATVSKAIDTVLGPTLGGEFRQAMDLTGAGNHPAFIKGFYKLASLVTEGSHVSGRQPSELGQRRPGAPASAAAAMYPNLPT